MLLLLIFGYLTVVCPLIEGTLDINFDGESAGCEVACENTYPLHTYPAVEHLEGCKRGCRFSTLIHFMHEETDVKGVRDLCLAACKDAYNQTFEHYACNVGCNNQDAYPLKSVENNETSYDMIFGVQSVFARMSGFVSSSWILYVSDDKSGKNAVIASSNDIANEDKVPNKNVPFTENWWSYQSAESSDWFPANGMSASCFYDFLHFLFFKIVVLFLIFVFILTVLTLLHLTLYDMTKTQRGYVSYIESAHYTIGHPYVTKLDV